MLESPYILSVLWNILIALVIISLIFVANSLRKRVMQQVDYLVAFTAWLIVAIVFLGFIPEILAHSSVSPELLGWLIISGILLFYFLELVLHWHHCKDISDSWHSHEHEHTGSPLLFVGTFAHNAIHGIVLYSAFYIDIHFGIAMTIAVLLHAIPQNIANFLMNHKDIRYVYIAAAWGVFWALILYPFTHTLEHFLYHILAVIGWGLLYTAMSDIFPSFKNKWVLKHKLLYFSLVVLGILSFIGLNALSSHDHSHDEHDQHHAHHYEVHENHEKHNEHEGHTKRVHDHHSHGDHDTDDHWDMSMRDMSTMLEGLSGDMLDKMFLEGMIPHHQAAIDMARYLENSEREALRNLWWEIIEVQQAEIEMMQNWLTEWNL